MKISQSKVTTKVFHKNVSQSFIYRPEVKEEKIAKPLHNIKETFMTNLHIHIISIPIYVDLVRFNFKQKKILTFI